MFVRPHAVEFEEKTGGAALWLWLLTSWAPPLPHAARTPAATLRLVSEGWGLLAAAAAARPTTAAREPPRHRAQT